jgi:RHS repeat-associated protein
MHGTDRFGSSKLARGLVAVRWRLIVFGLLVVLVTAGTMAVSATACGGGGGETEQEKKQHKEKEEKEAKEKKEEEENYAAGPEESFGAGNPSAPTVVYCLSASTVNCATGNLMETQTDLTVGGRGPGLNVTRTYNSQLAEKGEESSFGYGWTGPYSAHLVVNKAAETATAHQDNGSTVVFKLTGGKYAPESWVESTLVEETGPKYIFTLPNQTKLEFNNSGQLTKETDRNGNAVTLTYNGKGQLEKAMDAAGRELVFEYTEGQVTSVKDPMGHTVKYAYSAKNLASVTLPGEAKARWQFEYNGSHQLTKLTEGSNKTPTTTTYKLSRVVSQADPLGREYKWKYLGKPTTETKINEPNGAETVDHVNSEGEPTKITRASGTEIASTTEYGYNSSFDQTSMKDPNGHTTEYGYNSNDKTSEKDPEGDETKWEYDGTHDVKTITTPKGEKTTITRNANGDPEVIERPAPKSETQKTTYKYAANGDVESETDELGQTTTYTYDKYGDRESETDPEKNKRTWEYNKDSQETAEVSPRGNVEGAKASEYTTKTERDELGRPTKVTDPLGHVTEYKYNANGDLEAVTDGNKNITKYTDDEDNEQTKVEEPKATIETGYNAEGNVISHTDGNKHTTEYKRNLLGEVTEEINPLERKTKKTYDAAGNLKTVEDPEKNTTTNGYDSANRLIEVKYSTGKPATVTYEYDKDGNVTKMKDGTGETKKTYDELDRLTESKNGHGSIVKYEYNLENEPTKITYPNEKAVTRAYDKDSRLEKVTDWNSKATTFSYDPDSDLTATIFPAETKNEDKNTYNNADQMSEVKMMEGTETTVASLSYTRDGDGQVKTAASKGLPSGEATEFTNDEDNRLTKASATEYKYDAANNPTKIGATEYTYNKGDELETGTNLTYTYNEDGRRTKTKPSTGPATTYGYDQAGNLTTVERPEEKTEPEIKDSYTYDGNNLRASQTINGTTSQLTWDTAEELPLLLSDETNNYIYGPENLPIEQISSKNEPLYLHHDQQGSTRLVTTSTGKVETAYTYTPYGTTANKTGTASTPLLYDSQYTNTDTGLIYLRARTYDPQTAQFLSIDPALEETGEPYSYTTDNPINKGDPTGEQQQPPPDQPPPPNLNFGERMPYADGAQAPPPGSVIPINNAGLGTRLAVTLDWLDARLPRITFSIPGTLLTGTIRFSNIVTGTVDVLFVGERPILPHLVNLLPFNRPTRLLIENVASAIGTVVYHVITLPVLEAIGWVLDPRRMPPAN